MTVASPRHRPPIVDDGIIQVGSDGITNGVSTAITFQKWPTSGQNFYSQYKMGLTIAGVASCLLVTTFDLFHVDVFLRVYELPLKSYSRGSVIFALMNTIIDFLGAWLLDSMASGSISRSDLIGISGYVFSICFMTPFFRWQKPSQWDGLHFVVTTSLYDTMHSFTGSLLGSLVTDNHHMNDKERVWFMASGKIANLFAAFLVARIGLALFDGKDMIRFRTFLWALTALAAALFLVAQIMTVYVVDWKTLEIRHVKKPPTIAKPTVKQRLQFGQVARDFWGHSNFWAWIGMEFFLESQVSFINSFLKTFVDRLVFDSGQVSREKCDWLLSMVQPLGLIAGIFCYLPIQRFGYRRLYPILFASNAILCFYMITCATYRSTHQIILFLLIYPTINVAVSSSGFHLAMSDMVLERKKMQAKEGRLDEPSLAAMYIGVNAIFCKPAESILPVLAAHMLRSLNMQMEGDQHVQSALFKVLVIPPLVFSILQWLSWRRYTLTPQTTNQMREELRDIPASGHHSMIHDEWHMDT